MSNATNLYKIIKSIQGFILIILGIVFCVFFKSPEMHEAISYCVGSVLLVYAVLTICFAYLFQRGIASSDMISGVVLSSISVFIFINPEIVTKFLPTLFGTMLLSYSLILIIETIIFITKKDIKKIVLFSIADAIFITVGTLIIVFGNSKEATETTASILVLIIGIILLLIGIAIAVFAIIAPRRDVLLYDNKLIKTQDEQDVKTPANVKKASKSQTKSSKSTNKAITKEDEVKAIEQKEETKEEAK